MNVDQLINEAMLAAQDGRLRNKNDKELDDLLSACLRYCAAHPHSRVYDPTIDVLRDEINRRLDERKQIEIRKQHEAAMLESKNLHSSVQKLGKPHWTLTPSFAVIVLTMIFAAIAAWPVIREWFSVSQPASKDSSFQSSHSNSTPIISLPLQTTNGTNRLKN